MQITPLPTVDCAVLHERFRPIDGQALYEAMLALGEKHGFGAHADTMVTSTEKDVHLFFGQYRVMVSQNAQALGPEGFQGALNTPFTDMAFPNARKAVAQHRANTFVTVAKGPTTFPSEAFSGEMGEILSQMAAITTLEDAQRAYSLCRDLVVFITEHNPASGIHWCTSDNLVPQQTFVKATEDYDFTFIGARPYLSSSAGRLGPGLPLAMTANGSQWLVGKIVCFAEAPVPFDWMLPTLHSFLKLCMMRGSLLPHMHTFSVDGQPWKVGVVHKKIEGFDLWEQVELVVLHHPEYGIFSDETPKDVIQYKYDTVADVRAGGRPVGDMARLRALAQANAAEKAREAAAAKPGFFGRMFARKH